MPTFGVLPLRTAILKARTMQVFAELDTGIFYCRMSCSRIQKCTCSPWLTLFPWQVTPVWRAGPYGPKTLCNACGVRYMKQVKKK